uniref:Uncharacterized protein n=1 Tax=Siphoviridae sp. ctnMR5 TaxID=2825658 RepID=A0A8S5U8U3_9CAUD|nr:MAG TPA: hypothetical protein [Siphoviridae sp. ctnMR5]
MEQNRISDKVAALAEALKKAKIEALKLENVDDGGTCNLDCPTLCLERWRESDVKKACELANLSYSKWEDHYYNYHILGACYGQANRRTDMAEAFTQSMKASGYNAAVWYAMD